STTSCGVGTKITSGSRTCFSWLRREGNAIVVAKTRARASFLAILKFICLASVNCSVRSPVRKWDRRSFSREHKRVIRQGPERRRQGQACLHSQFRCISYKHKSHRKSGARLGTAAQKKALRPGGH